MRLFQQIAIPWAPVGAKKFWLIFFPYSPCSGLVISGYSKTLTDKLLIKHLAKDIVPYKKFKKMYKVDTTDRQQRGLKKKCNWYSKLISYAN